MSGATLNLVDGNIGGAFDHANAIIAGANDGLAYSHIVGGADVDAVGVRAIPRSKHMEVPQPNVLAPSYENVDSFAIH